MGMPVWNTPGGNLGVIADNAFFTLTLSATDTGASSLTYKLVSGKLPIGLTLTAAGVLFGSPVKFSSANTTQTQFNADVTSKFVIRATNTFGIVADRTFEITVTGESPPILTTPSGSLGNFYTGDFVDVQITASDSIPNAILTFNLYNGSLPPGLSLSSTGVITGHVQPAPVNAGVVQNYDEGPFDYAPFDFSSIHQDLTYAFTVQVTDGVSYALGTYSFYIISRSSLTADNTQITADEMVPTADEDTKTAPYITTPSENIGTTNSGDYFTFQFHGFDPDGDTINFTTGSPLLVNTTHITVDSILYTCDEISSENVPIALGLTLDPVTGWLYGTIPVLPISTITYLFTVSVYKVEFPTYVSVPVDFALTVNGEFADVITWITPSNLGTIDNGAISTLEVEALSADGVQLYYQIAPDSASELPQGLTFLQDGLIAGRVSFKFFEFDGGTTTFDNDTTTFESKYTFTVQAINNKKNVTSERTFTLVVDAVNSKPYQNLYLLSYVDDTERLSLNSLLANPSVLTPNLIYRHSDSYFGISPNLNMLVLSGVNPVIAAAYIAAMEKNHYNKTLYFGDIKTAVALNPDGSTLYEVIYVEMKDPQENSIGQSSPLSLPDGDFPEIVTGTVYPNSITNMRNQIAYGPMDLYTQIAETADNGIITVDSGINTADQGPITNNSVGIANYSTLPLWMTSVQTNGNILGYTKSFVICYCNPGTSARLLYNIDQYGLDFKQISFKADRYVWDNTLSVNWDAGQQKFIKGTQTTFDNNSTTFDQNSTRFFSEVDNYEPFQEGNSYLKFPKYNIVE